MASSGWATWARDARHPDGECRSDRAQARFPAASEGAVQSLRFAIRNFPLGSDPVLRTTDWREVVDASGSGHCGGTGGWHGCRARDRRRRHRQSQIGGDRQQGTDGAMRRRDLGSRHRGRNQPRHGGQRGRRHSHPRGVARGHFGRPHHRALRHPERHQQLHPHRDRKARCAIRTVLAEAQQLGYAEADPSADVDGFDARSKLAILSALAFGEKITPSDIFTEGIRRIRRWISNMRTNCSTPSGWFAPPARRLRG